jgi:hypothetical protein
VPPASGSMADQSTSGRASRRFAIFGAMLRPRG